MSDAGPNSGNFREAAAGAVTPDAETAALLAKHSAGEKLTQSEYGKVGAFAALKKKLFPGNAGSPGEPGNSRPSPGDASRMASLAPAQTEGNGLATPLPDPDLCRRTTAAILKSCSGIAVRYVGREARRTGADDRTVGRLESAAALPPAQQELMVDVSPDVLASLGMDPRNYPLVAFFGALGLWGTNVWLVVDDLRAMQKDQEKARAERLHQENKTEKVVPVTDQVK